MFFQAETNGVKYEINVIEGRKEWKVNLRPDGEDWREYNISKDDYQYFNKLISFLFKKKSYLVDVLGSGTDYTVFTRGSYRKIQIFNEETLLHESLKGKRGLGGKENLMAGMPGKIVAVFVKDGQDVKEGAPLLVMEAMKMENEMCAGVDAKIKSVKFKVGDNVEAGALLIEFE